MAAKGQTDGTFSKQSTKYENEETASQPPRYLQHHGMWSSVYDYYHPAAAPSLPDGGDASSSVVRIPVRAHGPQRKKRPRATQVCLPFDRCTMVTNVVIGM